MYYYIDGELYIPKVSNNGGIYSAAFSYYSCISCPSTYNIRTKNLTISFFNGIQKTSLIVLNQSNYDACYVGDNHAFYHKKELWNDGIYHSTAYYTTNGSETINIIYLSEDKRKFKGTFKMTVYHENTGVEKHITQGHFNINLDTVNNQ